MSRSWTIPSMASPAIPKMGQGVVFQAMKSSEHFPVLSFSMKLPKYLRKRLRVLVQYQFLFLPIRDSKPGR